MKNCFIGKSLWAIAFAQLGGLVSCDVIDEADRITLVETITIESNLGDTLLLPYGTGQELPVVMTPRILIEDFTGTSCTNCPDMAAFIEEKLCATANCVVACMHPDGLPNLARFITTPEAAEYAHVLGNLQSLPGIAVNRTLLDDDYVLEGTSETVFNTVQSRVMTLSQRYNYAQKNRLIGIGISVDTIAEGQYRLHTGIKASDAHSERLCLCLWLLADGITGYVLNGTERALPQSGFTGSYVHRHAFRRSLNGTWGEPIELQQANEYGLVCEQEVSITEADGLCQITSSVSSPMIIDHYEVVAVLFDADTKEVLNCASVAL